MTPTSEQDHIVSLIKSSSDNILVNALAGTGKTSTLELIQDASPDKPVLCLAFNKRIAEEMAERFPSTTTIRTFNSLGHRIWQKAVGNVTLAQKKTQDLLKQEIEGLKGQDRKEVSEHWFSIVSAVGLAKSLGYIPDGKFPQAKRLADSTAFKASLEERLSPLAYEIIDSILISSIKAAYAGSIDYNDQIYMPSLFGGTFPRYPLVLVDEAQDLSPTNLTMLKKLVRQRVCAVGDRWQSIYGFRGATTGGMDWLQREFEMTSANLSVSFRCPRAIVENARWRAPEFKWIKDGGLVGELRNPTLNSISDNSAIICRNNAPLFKLAFNLLSHKRSVSVAGSDIGPKLVNLLKKVGAETDTRADLLFKIEAWENEKLQTTNSAATILDMAACMRIFAGFGDTLAAAIAYAKLLFESQGTIKLMTGHKAKGLEFDTVYLLDRWLIKDQGQDEQEKNLLYVCQTRSKAILYEMNSEDIR